jgi:NADPH-dependent ferric siderophore reductase
MSNPASPEPGASRPRKPRYEVTVRRVQPLTPHMVCVTFAAAELARFEWNGPAAHIKLFFNDGTASSGPEPPRPVTRTYTPRRLDAAAGELDVEFVIHGEGPASTWAQKAAPGQSLVIAGPGRSYSVDPTAQWYLLAGDDTAIPAIATILEALPGNMRASVLLEVVDAAEERALTSAPHIEVRWLHRGADPARAGSLLEAAVRRLELPAGEGRVYVACEADAMRRIRRHLLVERGVPKPHLVTRGYWRLGATDHPDRDYGEDVG